MEVLKLIGKIITIVLILIAILPVSITIKKFYKWNKEMKLNNKHEVASNKLKYYNNIYWKFISDGDDSFWFVLSNVYTFAVILSCIMLPILYLLMISWY